MPSITSIFVFSSARLEPGQAQLTHRWILLDAHDAGRVKIARHTITHQYAAVKIVPRPRPTSSANTDVKADKVRLLLRVSSRIKLLMLKFHHYRFQMLLGIEREIVIMKLVEHPNVLRLMDVWETEKELCGLFRAGSAVLYADNLKLAGI